MAKKNNEPKSYAEAIERLENIVGTLEHDNPALETLADSLKEAQALLKYCQTTLVKVETDVNNILNSDE